MVVGPRVADPVLIKGDWRIDFGMPTQHTLGQSFTAGHSSASSLLDAAGNQADAGQGADAGFDVTVRRVPKWQVFRTTIAPRTQRSNLVLRFPPGRTGVGTMWNWPMPRAAASGTAVSAGGPTRSARGRRRGLQRAVPRRSLGLLKCLFDYGYDCFGPEKEGVGSYAPRYRLWPEPSGRTGDPIVCVSYWEQFGGGEDMWSSLWFPSACSAMAELARWQGLVAEARHYENLRRVADESFRRTFGREVYGKRRARVSVTLLAWTGTGGATITATLTTTWRRSPGESLSLEAARGIFDWLDHGAYLARRRTERGGQAFMISGRSLHLSSP